MTRPATARTRENSAGPDVFRVEPLSWPQRPDVDDCRIDDLDRHLAARARLRLLTDRLTAKYRREFPAHRYAATAEGSHREMAALLSQYGGLPKVDGLNGVPAEVLEKAVEAFAAYFGLEVAGAGVPAGSGFGAAELDPAPHRRLDMEAPW